MLKYPTIYLASNSPRRKEIFENAGFTVELIKNNASEEYDPLIPPKHVAQYIAEQKAKPFKYEQNKLIVTADTTVILENEILNKPKNEQHAAEMLRKLSGKKHEVITGVCIIKNGTINAFSEVTLVWVKPLTEEEIAYYIFNFKPFDKAGAYGIQDWMGLVGVSKIEGCYYNVMGFPMHKFVQKLNKLI